MTNRNIMKKSLLLIVGLLIFGVLSCKEKEPKKDPEPMEEIASVAQDPFFKLSLAQWSMHKMILEEGVDPYTFAEKAKSWGFSGLEYVSYLYNEELEEANFSKEAMDQFIAKNNLESKKHGMQNLLIMIDGQGDLATTNAIARKKAVENHYKWVDAAAAMGCHSIRVNLAGSKVPEEWTANAVDGLTQLASYAKDKNINIIVENHGGLSSNAALLAGVMKKVNMDNCGTLPDFGNFCVRRVDGSDYNGDCAETYDMYKGVKELMPFAKGVSAKSYDFDAQGNETKIDYAKMLQIVKDADYNGYIGVEYEGSVLSETEGILATKQLLIQASETLR
ncbi:sugar phosphate isomerase/epimerase family protein [Cellulophaga sp. Hel_I_12]|uniref:sugar phosphate isomerase/epimerase family protein n=1 Tax=Cellulophaga sp. Hel_I_12 TaxID=1249972 RepID=UPI000647A820